MAIITRVNPKHAASSPFYKVTYTENEKSRSRMFSLFRYDDNEEKAQAAALKFFNSLKEEEKIIDKSVWEVIPKDGVFKPQKIIPVKSIVDKVDVKKLKSELRGKKPQPPDLGPARKKKPAIVPTKYVRKNPKPKPKPVEKPKPKPKKVEEKPVEKPKPKPKKVEEKLKKLAEKKPDEEIDFSSESFVIPDEFDFPGKFEKGEAYTLALVGSTKSGKTTLIKEVMYPLLKKISDVVFVFSNSLHKEMYSFIDEEDRCWAFDAFNSDIIKILFKIQKETANKLNIAVLLDDEISAGRNMMIKRLYSLGRNSNITTVMSVQDLTYINASSRNNFNYFFLLRNNTRTASIIENFLLDVVEIPKSIHRLADRLIWLKKWYKTNTEDHKIIVIDYLNANLIFQYKVKLK